jgi:hypothetical protein
MVVVTEHETERENPERTTEGKFLERQHEPLGHLSDKIFYLRVYTASRNTNTVNGMRKRGHSGMESGLTEWRRAVWHPGLVVQRCLRRI